VNAISKQFLKAKHPSIMLILLNSDGSNKCGSNGYVHPMSLSHFSLPQREEKEKRKEEVR